MKENQKDILVIDDEQVILDAVVKICSFEKYAVDAAPDAAQAVKLLEKNSYGVIICDIMMPETDGFEFIDILAEKKIDTPIIMATGYSTVENAVRSLYKGGIDFIPKPFTADELLSSVKRGLRYSEMIIKGEESGGELLFVPCPAKYYRLGYASWLKTENDGTALCGVTDMFLKVIESVLEISFTGAGEEVIQGISFCRITSNDGLIHEVLSPVSGRIIETNKQIGENRSLIEKDPFFNGWLYRVIPSDMEYDLKNLTSCSSDRI
jgi:CheY-like chemotaxis protein/glycine cleavage system H lipoate-binding protein